MRQIIVLLAAIAIALVGCDTSTPSDPGPVEATETPAANQSSATTVDPFWRNATIYFLLTDRFANGDPSNDNAYGRVSDGAPLRSFMGGDIAGMNQKLAEGYFSDLGITALWTTPLIEQISSPFDEYGRSYPYHGYWPRDWTTTDKGFGTEAEFAQMIELAHEQKIRIVMDVILNHAGPPVNETDPAWPEDWVRTEPRCDWGSFDGVATCLIVPALQDIRTESDAPVGLPPHLIAKWEREGRLDQELAELDAFFERTEYPRAPKYYIIKWLTDWVREHGIDAFRIDTAKHVDPEVWAALKTEAEIAFADWKTANPDNVIDDRDFYMFGEVFNFGANGFQYSVAGTRDYDFGDRRVDFFDYGFDGLINMAFATHARLPVPDLFQLYANELADPFGGVALVNYISSHDDMAPLDPERKDPYGTAVKLLLAPGSAQIYYGDELGRSLVVEGTTGDATLRSFMNWDALETKDGQALLTHWQRLAQFRGRHPAIGAGVHTKLAWSPYTFSRVLDEGDYSDRVVVALPDQPIEALDVYGVFADGTEVREAYSGEIFIVQDSIVEFSTRRQIALLERAP
ncbi:MAG: alpha-amylase family glycosyl hydrolase [Pseudomonadota bacterium]